MRHNKIMWGRFTSNKKSRKKFIIKSEMTKLTYDIAGNDCSDMRLIFFEDDDDNFDQSDGDDDNL